MSRIPKWKAEKTKVKVVFRLQFHATHIPQGWDKLFVSFVPSDTGKVTAKTTKTNVRNGSCKWSDPIYETTRLLQDTRTKRYEEKAYKLVVATGSSRSSLLGEVNVNLADFADALKPSSVSLPLNNSDTGTILHVTVQLLTSKTGFREFEQQRELSVKGVQNLQMIPGQRSHGTSEVLGTPYTASGQIDKVNAGVRIKEAPGELPSHEEAVKSTEDNEDSAVGVDSSSCTSEGLYAEKNDVPNMHEADSFKSTHGDAGRFLHDHSPGTANESQSGKRLCALGSNELAHGWSSDYSVENELASPYDENCQLRVRLELAESAFSQLKLEAESLQSITAELGAETQCLAQQLVAELDSGEKLTREVSILKSDCSKLKTDLEDLKSAKVAQHIPDRSHLPINMKRDLPDSSVANKIVDNALASEQNYLFHDVQLKYLQSISLIEGQIQEIQNKACLEYHEIDIDVLHSDFEILKCTLQNVKQHIKQTSSLDATGLKEIQTGFSQPEHFVQEREIEMSFRARQLPEGASHLFNGSLLVSCGEDLLNEKLVDSSMKEKIGEILNELEESKIDKESLAQKMNQMECYYEALIQELEESQKQALNELENLKAEHASSLYKISSLQNQIKNMHQDMNEQLIRFAEDRNKLDSLNIELEKRAIASESALKRVRWNYSIAVDRLQKDLEVLSFQVLSMYETNENLAKQAFTDASQLFLQNYPESLKDEISGLPKDDVLSLSCKEQYKHNATRIRTKAVLDVNHESSAMSNGVSKVSFGTCNNYDLAKENKDNFQNTVPVDVDSQLKSYACANGLKSDDIRHLVSETQRDNECAERSIVKSKHHSPGANCLGIVQMANQCAESCNESLDDKHDLEGLNFSLHLHSNTEADLSEIYMLNLHLEVFSVVLREILHNVYNEMGCMNNQMGVIKQQLAHSTDIEESLMLRLHHALGESRRLEENESNLTSKCDSLKLQNHILEAKLQDLIEENTFCSQKVVEYEKMMVESRVFESKYNSCIEEKELFKSLLKEENIQKSYLQNQFDCLSLELKALKERFDKQCSLNNDLQNALSSLHEKLGGVCSGTVSCYNQLNGSILDGASLQHELQCKNYMGMIMHLEHFLQEGCKTILQLNQKQREIEEQRDVAQYSLNETESEILSMKQKFDTELEEIRAKLELSNKVSESLQFKLQDAVAKLKLGLEAEEKQAINNKQLLAKLSTLEIELQQATEENKDLVRKVILLEGVNGEFGRLKSSFTNCMEENQTLIMSIQLKNEASVQLENEISRLKDSLRCTQDELQTERRLRQEIDTAVTHLTLQLGEKCKQLLYFDDLKSESVDLRKKIVDLETENLELQHLMLQTEERQRDVAHDSLNKTESEILSMKQKFDSELEEISAKLDMSNKISENLQLELQDALGKHKLHLETEEKQAMNNNQLLAKVSNLDLKLQHATDENKDLIRKIMLLEGVVEELGELKSSFANCMQENRTLMMSIELRNEASMQMENELNSLKESLRCTQEELQIERRLRQEIDTTVTDLTLQLEEKCKQLLNFDDLKVESVNLREKKLDLETENSELQHLILRREEKQRKLEDETSYLNLEVSELENQLEATIGYSLTYDVEVAYLKSQLQYMIRELGKQSKTLDELRLDHIDVVASLERLMANESQLVDENARLSTALHSLKSELDTIILEKKGLMDRLDQNCAILSEVEDMKNKVSIVEADHSREKQKHVDETCELKNILVNLEKEMDSLRSSKDELQITNLILESKLDEQKHQLSFLEACNHDFKKLREQHNELSHKLSEQSMKTEEFKNLSIHLREQKDKADAECNQVREKREADGSTHAMQDSLRIAFLKEQYETKLQELRNQLFVSKKYAEEMLLKLQNALNESESAKKSEVSLAKCNEGLSTKISDLETELQKVLVDRRELGKAYDRMKAELECKTLSLDCCKEEKVQVEASLQECNEGRTKLRVELDLVKRLLENMASVTDTQSPKDLETGTSDTTSVAQLLENNGDSGFSVVCEESSAAISAYSICDSIVTCAVSSEHPIDGDNLLVGNSILISQEVEDVKLACIEESPHSNLLLNVLQDGHVPRSALEEEILMEDSKKRIANIKEHFKEQQKLKNGMDLLHKELERLKNENLSSVLPLEDNNFDPALQALQRELTQLEMANEHLISIFPSFKELPGSGNALERVLALELELAEALQAKKKSDIRFQSSFLKQHSDETAVYQSFRDINDLIKDMLELKRRNASVAAELKDMQGRYSQLSLKFAEVEGERQKLVMTLKSRLPKKS